MDTRAPQLSIPQPPPPSGGITYNPPGSPFPGTVTFSTEMWALNLVTSTWQQVQQTTPWPERAGGWFSTGLVLGRSFLVYELSRQGNQLLAWSPSPFGPPPASAPVTFSNTTTAAVSAGFAIEILLGIASLAVLVSIWRGQGGGRKQVTAASMGDIYSGLPAESL